MTSDQNIIQQVAMKALVVDGNKVLVVREAATYAEGTNAGKYQLPGGRVEKGENIKAALRREVLEETGLTVSIEYPIYVGEWLPIIRGKKHQIVGIFVVCKPKDLTIKLSTEHDDYKWVNADNHNDYDILSPDYLAIDEYARR